ncbi:MAG TPA: hypothetical protein PLV42_12050 [bacterium]|nr:hypothetical protein [bacterium]
MVRFVYAWIVAAFLFLVACDSVKQAIPDDDLSGTDNNISGDIDQSGLPDSDKPLVKDDAAITDDAVVVDDSDAVQPEEDGTSLDNDTVSPDGNSDSITTTDEDAIMPTDVDEAGTDTLVDETADEAADEVVDDYTPQVDQDVVVWENLDEDDDGILNGVEGLGDADGDGTANYLDTDSDDDGIPDMYEGDTDFESDGVPNFLDTDSDNDGFVDSVEYGGSAGSAPIDSDGDGYMDFVDTDSDSDGLTDSVEIYCANIAKDSRTYLDTDGDGYDDLAEKAVGSDLCDPLVGVKDFVDFYFVLPYQDPEKTDVLTFAPTVRKTDIFFNVDTTYSMSEEINNLKTGLSTIMTETKNRVSDSAFGVSHFEDFPICDFGASSDVPWELLQSPTTNATTAQNGVNALSLGDGLDIPESGYESLYQLATGAGGSVSYSSGSGCDSCSGSGSIPAYTGGGLGGVGFRSGSIPIALHITDAPSHTPVSGSSGMHSRDETITALNALGVRTITVQPGTDTDATPQLNDISDSTGAKVPVCAFKTGVSSWRCGDSKCCTLSGGSVNPTGGQCTLRYQIPADGSGLGTSVVDGIDAVVKYATFNVLSLGKDDGDGLTIDTACFLKKIESLQFVSPPDEPEKSCAPTAQPAAYNGSAYNNGFSNFATGTSSPAKVGSKLLFTVHAQNDTCFEPTSTAAVVFTAYIDILDQVTGAVLDTQTVTIIVPGKKDCGSGGEGGC